MNSPSAANMPRFRAADCAGIRLLEIPEPIHVGKQDLFGIVRGAVVDHDDLDVLERLRMDAARTRRSSARDCKSG